MSDAVWADVRAHYDEDQAVALVGLVAVINAWNRINVVWAPRCDFRSVIAAALR